MHNNYWKHVIPIYICIVLTKHCSKNLSFEWIFPTKMHYKKIQIVTEKFGNCDGKFQFVMEIVTESTPSQFQSSQIHLWRIRHKLWRTKVRHNFLWRKICDGRCPSQNGCDGLCDGHFRHKIGIVTEIVTDTPSQFPSAKILFGGNFVTEWISSVTKLWRNPSHSVTNCDRSQPIRHNLWRKTVTDFRHIYKLWRCSVTNSVTNYEKN